MSRIRVRSRGHGETTEVFVLDAQGEEVPIRGILSLRFEVWPGQPARLVLEVKGDTADLDLLEGAQAVVIPQPDREHARALGEEDLPF